MAAAAVIGGALLLFFSGFDVLNNLQSVDTRERLAQMLGSGSAGGLGLTVDDLVRWMHAATLVTGAAAAAATVLGWFALQGHRGARLGLAAVAVVLLVCAPFSGGLLAGVVVVAIAMLWTGPARDWFAGRPIRQPADRGSSVADRVVAQQQSSDDRPPSPQTPQTPPVGTPPSAPPPSQGFGDRPVAGPAAVPPGYPAAAWPGSAPQQPASYPSGPQPQETPPSWPSGAPVQEEQRRPGTVVAACIITWAFSALALAGCAVLAFRLGSDASSLVSLVQRSYASTSPQTSLDPALIRSALWLGFAFYLAWALAACVLALLAWRRHQWARIVLIVSAVAAGLLGLVAAASSGGLLALPHAVACAVVVGLLLGGRAGRWYQRVPRRPAPQTMQQPPGQGRPPRAW